MDTSRRSFLVGAASGLTMLVLTACTDQETPTPTPTPTGEPPVPQPLAVVRTSWGADPFARGSSSFLAVGSSPAQRQQLAEPLLDRVFFAGEATADEFPNTVQGAEASGSRAANQVAAVSEPNERVIVVGAGIAGAAAARRLKLTGHDVQVIEARDRIGGRIQTVESEDWPVPLQLGAAWVPADEENFLVLRLERLGISTEVASGSEARTADGETTDLAAGDDAVQQAVKTAAEGASDISLAGALAQTEATESDEWPVIDAYLATQIESVLGGRAADLSSWYALDELPEDLGRMVLGDYQSMVADALDGIDVSMDTPVTGISYEEGGVSLRLSTGESVSADRVVLTVPLGVLKDAGITFDPPLPFERRAAIAEVGVGVQDTVWLLFEEPFWSTDAVIWTVVGEDVAVPTWVNLQPLTGSPILVGRVSGEAAEALAALDDDAALAAALQSLVPFAESA
jgi:monoamine oxidase